MATKTSSKTATRKPAARGTAAAHKPAAAAKTKLPKQKIKEDAAATPPKPGTSAPPKSSPETARPLSREAESVSLIDQKKPRKKAEDAEPKPKRDVFPPISRIRASLETPSVSPKPAPPAKPPESLPTEGPGTVTPEKTAPDASALPSAEPETAAQKVILIKPPIVVKQLTTELGLKPHQLIA